MPRRSGYPQGSGEVLERDRGFANPLSLSNRPREEQIKSTRMTWYSSWEKAKQTIKAKRRFLINTKEYQQTQFDKPTASQIGKRRCRRAADFIDKNRLLWYNKSVTVI